MSLLVSVLVVIRDILVKVLETSPAVEVVPEVVEVLNLVLGGIGVAEGGNGVSLGETSLGLEDLAPESVVVAFLQLLLGRGLDIGLLINGVVLAALSGIKKNLGGLLDTLEELVVIGTSLCGLLIGVVLEDLLTVGLLDLFLGSLVAVLGQAKNLVVILGLYKEHLINILTLLKTRFIVTFQSLAWSWSSIGSSGSLISLSSPSSTFLALSWA